MQRSAPEKQMFEVLSALESRRWHEALAIAGLTPTATIGAETRARVVKLLRRLSADLDVLVYPVSHGLQALLDGLAGKSFGCLEANKEVARELQRLTNRLGLRIACPRQGCGRPASIRCARAGNSRHGVFQFDHPIGRRRTTHLGSSTFPCLTLVPPSPDRRSATPPS